MLLRSIIDNSRSINDTSRDISMMTVSDTPICCVILMTLEVSFKLLTNIYSRGVTHDDRHVMIVIYL